MTELVLNLCWLALVIFALVWRWRTSFTGRGRAVLGLACAALLVFPTISISDDLHVAEGPYEEASKRTVKTVRSLISIHVLPALPAVSATSQPRMGYWESLSEIPAQSFDGTTTGPHTGRAPPKSRA